MSTKHSPGNWRVELELTSRSFIDSETEVLGRNDLEMRGNAESKQVHAARIGMFYPKN